MLFLTIRLCEPSTFSNNVYLSILQPPACVSIQREMGWKKKFTERDDLKFKPNRLITGPQASPCFNDGYLVNIMSVISAREDRENMRQSSELC
jgi:hypothetical protein